MSARSSQLFMTSLAPGVDASHDRCTLTPLSLCGALLSLMPGYLKSWFGPSLGRYLPLSFFGSQVDWTRLYFLTKAIDTNKRAPKAASGQHFKR